MRMFNLLGSLLGLLAVASSTHKGAMSKPDQTRTNNITLHDAPTAPSQAASAVRRETTGTISQHYPQSEIQSSEEELTE